MKRLLLTGASGFLGSNVSPVASTKYEVVGVSNTKKVTTPYVRWVKANLTDDAQLRGTFSFVKPDAVIHLAANSDPNYCQQHPRATRAINVDIPIKLARICAVLDIPYVFTSTDLVFDGQKGNYNEHDVPAPLNIYAEQKLAAEKGILSANPNAIICRMPLMFGNGGPVAKSFLQPFLTKMQAGEPLSLFHDEYRSVVGGQSAAEGLILAMENFKGGIYHLGGRERLSRYEFGMMIKDAFDLPQAIINSCSQKDVTMPAPRPADVTMDSSQAYSLGYQPMSVMEELKGLVGVI